MRPHRSAAVAAPVRALLEAFVVEAQAILPDAALQSLLEHMVAGSLHQVRGSSAATEKVRELWKLGLGKLGSATSFKPGGDMLQTVGLPMADFEQLRNQPEVTTVWSDVPEDLYEMFVSPPKWEDLRHVFKSGGVVQEHVPGYGRCLVLGHVAHGSISRTSEITIDDRVVPFKLVDSIFPTIRHDYGDGKIGLIKGVRCSCGRGRCWTSRPRSAPTRVRHFVVQDDGVHWVRADGHATAQPPGPVGEATVEELAEVLK